MAAMLPTAGLASAKSFSGIFNPYFAKTQSY
jgi:hypothetical protein